MNYDDFATDLSWLNLEEVEVPKKATSAKKGKSSGKEMTIGGLSFTLERIRYYSDEHRAKLREAFLGKKKSEETKAKMREAKLGKKKSDEHRAKLREALLGKKASEETKAKMREAKAKLQKPKVPKRGTPESKKVMSEAKKKFVMTPHGIFYGGKVVEETLKIKLSYWMKKHPDQYFYLD